MRDGQRGKTDVLEQVRQRINENFFYVPAHKTIYEMLVSLAAANKPLDLISFTEFLHKKDVLKAVGGAAYVTELHSYIDKLTNFVPTAANIDYYIGIVVEKFARREIIADATRLVRGAYGDDAEEFAVRVQRLTNRISHIGAAANGAFPALRDTAEFFSTDDPPMPSQVIYSVLHRGSKMLLGGNSKGRKTWALLDLAISVACGVDWWGFHTHKGAVCYLNLELQDAFFRWRAKTVCQTKNVQPEPGMLFAWNLRGHAKPMQQLVNELIGNLKQHHFALIIIDPIYKTLPAFRGSENDSAMITALLNEVESIAVETGAAVLFCSHFSKGEQADKESMDRISGSGAWARDPDSLLTMTAHEENECYTVEGTLRNMSPIFPFVVKWDFPLFIRQEELSPDRLRRRGPKGKSPDLLFEVLSEFNGMEPKDVVKAMKDQHDITRATVYRMKDVLAERGQFKIEEGLWFKVKPETKQETSSE
jgi:RecA-family ATPase